MTIKSKFSAKVKIAASLVVLALMALVASGLIWFFTSSPLSRLPENVTVDLTLLGINLVHGEDGQQQWALNATKADVNQGSESVDMEGVDITYIVEADNSTLTIVADSGRLDQRRKTATLWPWVTGEYNGMNLQGQRLLYEGEHKMLTLTGDVMFTGENIEGNASTMRMYLESGLINATGPVHAVIYMDALPTESEEDANKTIDFSATVPANAAPNGVEPPEEVGQAEQTGQNAAKK